MLRLTTIVAIVMTLSCDSEIGSPDPVDEVETTQIYEGDENTSGSIKEEIIGAYVRDEVWVCYNPDTEMHNKECVEETYPEGCYIEGSTAVFCWLLMKPECEKDGTSSPEACQLLRE